MRNIPANFRPVLTALVLAAAGLIAFPADAPAQEPDYAALLVRMLEEYQSVMVGDAVDDAADAPGRAWETVGGAIREGFLRFSIDPTNDSVVNGARFYAPPDEEVARIYVSPPLLEASEGAPALACGVLMRAVTEAAAFFENPEEWWTARGTEMGRLFLAWENYRGQAEMTRNRLIPTGPAPGAYGTFVLNSFENDGLSGAMLYLERFSMPAADALRRLRDEFLETGDTAALREGVIAFGEELISARESLPGDADDGTVYPAAVAVHTWLELTPDLITAARLGYGDRTTEDFGQILALEPEYAAVRRRLETSRTADMPLIFYVNDTVRSRFENQ